MSPPIARTTPAQLDPVPVAPSTPATQYMSHGIVSGPIPLYPTGTAALVPAPPTYEVIPNRIFVGGYPSLTTESELREHFEQFHPVKDVKMVKSLDGASKGYGFVTFEIEDQAEEVRQLNPKQLEFRGRKLNLGPAIRKMSSGPYTSGYAIAAQTQLVPASPSPFGYALSPTAGMVFFPQTQPVDQSHSSPLNTPTTQQTQFFFTNDSTPARSYANAVAGGEPVAPQSTEISKSSTPEVAQNSQNGAAQMTQQYVQPQPQQPQPQQQQPQYTPVPQNQYNQPQPQVAQNQGSYDQQQQPQPIDPSNVQNGQYYNYGYQQYPAPNMPQNGEFDKTGMSPNGYMANMQYYHNGGNYQNMAYPYMPYQYSSYAYHPQTAYQYGYPRYGMPNQMHNGGYHQQNPQYSDNGAQNQFQNGQNYQQHQNQNQQPYSTAGYHYPPLTPYSGPDVQGQDYGNSRNSPSQHRGGSNSSSNNNNSKKNRYSESRDENSKGSKSNGSPHKGSRGDKRTWSGGNSLNEVSQKGKNSKNRGQLTPLTNKMRSLSISSNGNMVKN